MTYCQLAWTEKGTKTAHNGPARLQCLDFFMKLFNMKKSFK